MTAKEAGYRIRRADYATDRPWILDYGQSYRSFQYKFEAVEQLNSDLFDLECPCECGGYDGPSDADSGL